MEIAWNQFYQASLNGTSTQIMRSEWTDEEVLLMEEFDQIMSRFRFSAVTGRGDGWYSRREHGARREKYDEVCQKISSSLPKTGLQMHGQQRIVEQSWPDTGLHYHPTLDNFQIHARHMHAERQILKVLTALEIVAEIYDAPGHQPVLGCYSVCGLNTGARREDG